VPVGIAEEAMTTPIRPSYIIEHMEDLDADPTSPTTFPQWALLEYRQMLKDVGQGGTVHFTGLVSESSKEALRQALSSASSNDMAVAEFQVHSEGILEMAKKNQIDIQSICLLDPKSPFPLSIQDAGIHSSDSNDAANTSGGPFSHFLFGGILGDDPPRDRTGHLRAMQFPSRHLGGLQMTTDSALNVVKLVVEDGIAMGLPGTEAEGPKGVIDWIDNPELHLGQGESVSL
jgi:ribosome biogenesis SPOUT family RNA methylase Rps3